MVTSGLLSVTIAKPIGDAPRIGFGRYASGIDGVQHFIVNRGYQGRGRMTIPEPCP